MSSLSWRRESRMKFLCFAAIFVFLSVGPSDRLWAQDTIPPIEQGVRLGITYTPGMRASDRNCSSRG